MLKKRDKLSKRQINEKSHLIAKALLKLPDFRSAEMVMFYAAKSREVDTWKMIAKALCSKRIALPVTEKATGKITPYEITSLNKDLKAGAFGVYEPQKELCGIISDKEIDLVIVPGIAFDRKGNRLGYGKGCYDRWLKNIPPEKRIAIAFSEQLLEKVPVNKKDVKVCKIITEKEIITTEGTRK
jgi:5-formyltetrahydrofolate cyclo-ligase